MRSGHELEDGGNDGTRRSPRKIAADSDRKIRWENACSCIPSVPPATPPCITAQAAGNQRQTDRTGLKSRILCHQRPSWEERHGAWQASAEASHRIHQRSALSARPRSGSRSFPRPPALPALPPGASLPPEFCFGGACPTFLRMSLQ